MNMLHLETLESLFFFNMYNIAIWTDVLMHVTLELINCISNDSCLEILLFNINIIQTE